MGGQPCDEVFTDLAGDEPLSVGVGRGGDNAYQDLAALADVDDLAGPAASVPVLARGDQFACLFAQLGDGIMKRDEGAQVQVRMGPGRER